MIKVTFLAEQKVKEYSGRVTGFDILQPDALREAIAFKVNGELYDLSREIESDTEIEVIQLSDEAGLDIIRHDAAHIMAQAVKSSFLILRLLSGQQFKMVSTMILLQIVPLPRTILLQ